MKHYIILYLSTLIALLMMDLTWIGVIAREFYKDRFGDLMEFHALPAVLFYLIYVVAILVFVNGGEQAKWQSTLMYGGLFGFFAYMTYDLTNMATIRGWSLSLVIVDIAWGTVVTALAATLGGIIASYIEG